jgi:hypothetical protein
VRSVFLSSAELRTKMQKLQIGGRGNFTDNLPVVAN